MTTSRPSRRDSSRPRAEAFHRHVDLATEGAQLLDGGRALQVGADQQRVAALRLEPAGQLGGVRGLARALQAGHEHDGGWLRRERDLQRVPTERGDKLLVDDLDDLLRRREALGQVGAHAGLADAPDEVAYHAHVDIGFEQRDANLAQHLLDVGLAESTLAAKTLEDAFEPIGEATRRRTWRPSPADP
jgi:hypothetical protein